MPVTLELVENSHVMLFTFTDPWDVKELIAIYPTSQAYLDNATHKVHTLTDVRNARHVPSGILTARRGPDWSHPSSGHVVIVGAVLLISTFARTVLRLVHFERVHFFETMDEAWIFLRKAIAEEQATANSGAEPT
jgi:hypothetical protein